MASESPLFCVIVIVTLCISKLYMMLLEYFKTRVPLGRDPHLCGKVYFFSKYNYNMPTDYNNYIYIIVHLYGHIMKTFTSDGLLYVFKTYKVIQLYWHVSYYNIII